MLALAHPVQHTPVDCSHRPSPQSASSSSRSFRTTPRRPSSYTTTDPSPSSHPSSILSSGRAPHPERHPSPRRHQFATSTVPHVTHPARDSEPPIPPPPDGNSGGPSHVRKSRQSEVDIHSYDPQQLLRILASLLTQIATTNDKLSRRDGSIFPPRASALPPAEHPPIWYSLTSASREALSGSSSLTFHARNIPSISLEAYLIRILKYCPASNEVFLSLLVYFDRMSKLAKEAHGRLFVIDSYNIHRLVIAGVTVASKFFSDVFYTNSRYAKVGGLPQGELNQLELQFLLLNDFRLMIAVEEMQSYAEQLIRFSQTNSDSSQFTSPLSSSQPLPAGPTKFLNFVGGAHHSSPSHLVSHSGSQTPQVGPTRSFRHSVGASSDGASEAETDVDGSTDDEPTIRPPRSSNSSETMSLHSTASDSDTLYTDDGDESSDETGFEVVSGVEYSMRSP